MITFSFSRQSFVQVAAAGAIAAFGFICFVNPAKADNTAINQIGASQTGVVWGVLIQ